VTNLLAAAPPPWSVPVVVVQHISRGFAEGFAEWIGTCTGHHTLLVDRNRRLDPGTVYVAPDDCDIGFVSPAEIAPLPAEDPAAFHPSIDETFSSAARVFGANVAALLLTGMGRDGARGLLALAERGATTVAQEPLSCVVGSMPQAAIDLQAATAVYDVEGLQGFLRRLQPP
jgi:two-component system chemotaxis response regulator CheB